MNKTQLKRRKKILQDISLGRFTFYLQPLEKLYHDKQSCVEVIPYYQKYTVMCSFKEILEDLEKDMSIVIFDLYVFEKICEVLHVWHQKHFRPIRFHIQLSHITIEQYDLDKQLELIRNRYHVNVQDIGIIVSFQKHTQVHEKQLQAINQLHRLGYLMILESEENVHLSMLSKVMFSMVKFEVSQFLENMKLERSMSYFYYILRWCREEQVEIMFGGIQNEQQKDYIQNLGCSYMIAPYLQKRLALEEFELLLTRQQLVNSYEN